MSSPSSIARNYAGCMCSSTNHRRRPERPKASIREDPNGTRAKPIGQSSRKDRPATQSDTCHICYEGLSALRSMKRAGPCGNSEPGRCAAVRDSLLTDRPLVSDNSMP